MTSAATSISASASRSRPVISQSIHTSRSFTMQSPYSGPLSAPVSGRSGTPRVGGVKQLDRARSRGWSPVASGSSPARSSCPTRRAACAPSAPTTCCRSRSCRRSGYALPVVEVVLGVCLVLGLLTRAMAVRVGAAVRGLHHRHRVGVGARAADRLRLLRRRRRDRGRDAKYPWEIARDVGLLLRRVAGRYGPRTRWSLDSLFSPARCGRSLARTRTHRRGTRCRSATRPLSAPPGPRP